MNPGPLKDSEYTKLPFVKHVQALSAFRLLVARLRYGGDFLVTKRLAIDGSNGSYHHLQLTVGNCSD